MCAEAGRQIDLTVDGGINADTAWTAVEAGANVLVAGSSVFSAEHTVAQGIETLRGALAKQKPGLPGSCSD
jgi:ribulose-phosphate 3-epimerase